MFNNELTDVQKAAFIAGIYNAYEQDQVQRELFENLTAQQYEKYQILVIQLLINGQGDQDYFTQMLWEDSVGNLETSDYMLVRNLLLACLDKVYPEEALFADKKVLANIPSGLSLGLPKEILTLKCLTKRSFLSRISECHIGSVLSLLQEYTIVDEEVSTFFENYDLAFCIEDKTADINPDKDTFTPTFTIQEGDLLDQHISGCASISYI